MNSGCEQIAEQVDRELELLNSEVGSLLSGTGTEHLHSRALVQTGKLLRPRLLFICALHAAESRGESVNWSLARQAALAIELAHVGTLYHDDIVDQSTTRRGHPSVYREHGTVTAAYGGAHLLVLANRLAAEFPDRMVRDWALAASRVADGQTRELENAGNCELVPDAYIQIAQRKTGSLFKLAAQLGNYCGGGEGEAEREALSQFALAFGTSFQLFDDLADFSRPTSSHRPARTDLRNRTYTLPVLFGLCRDKDRELHSLLHNDGYTLNDQTVDLVCETLRHGDDFTSAEQRAHVECDVAEAALRELASTDARDRLLEMVSEARSQGRLARSAA
ncbi:MAG: heptaprenyl diphosphate synthase [Planctomycetota bacterium]|jgi:heptaprenyl diphosphate synthase